MEISRKNISDCIFLLLRGSLDSGGNPFFNVTPRQKRRDGIIKKGGGLGERARQKVTRGVP